MNTTNSTTRIKFQTTTGAALTTASLVAAAPFEALLSVFARDIACIRDRLPGSSELTTLQRLRDEVARTLDEARRADVWLSPRDVAEHTGKGLSTVTKECRDFGEVAGAVRNGKRAWLIHWPTYEAWMVATGREKTAA